MKRQKTTFTFGVMTWKAIQTAVNEAAAQINSFNATTYWFRKFLTWLSC